MKKFQAKIYKFEIINYTSTTTRVLPPLLAQALALVLLFSPLPVLHLVDLLGEPVETFFHILPSLRTGLEVQQVFLLHKVVDLVLRDHSFVLQVVLVPQQHDDGVLVAGLLLLGQPQRGDFPEGLHVGQVKNQHHRMGPFVKRLCQCRELLLSRGVPDLQLESVFLNLEGPKFEVDPNRG